MLIGELAEAARVSSQTVRLYERKRLLPEATRSANGYRVYDETLLARLRFINVAQAAGLTLSEIRSIIHLRDEGMLRASTWSRSSTPSSPTSVHESHTLPCSRPNSKHSWNTANGLTLPIAETTKSATSFPQ